MTIKERITDIGSSLSKENLLDSLGLQEKRQSTDYILPALGIFGAGLAVGAVLGLLFAPKSGRDLRGDVRSRIQTMRHRGQALPDDSQDASLMASTKAANPYAD